MCNYGKITIEVFGITNVVPKIPEKLEPSSFIIELDVENAIDLEFLIECALEDRYPNIQHIGYDYNILKQK